MVIMDSLSALYSLLVNFEERGIPFTLMGDMSAITGDSILDITGFYCGYAAFTDIGTFCFTNSGETEKSATMGASLVPFEEFDIIPAQITVDSKGNLHIG